VVRTLTTLELLPVTADLCAPGPFDTVQLTLVPRDQRGELFLGSEGTAEYSSSAQEIVEVTSNGLVRAAAPGAAVITAAFTLGDITRTASMTATVHEPPRERQTLAGVYDLAALVTTWDGALGLPPGSRETAVLTIQHSGDTPHLSGTFAELRAFYPEDDSYVIGPYSGVLSGTFDCVGRVVIELSNEGQQDAFWRGEGTASGRQIAGDFSSAVFAGTFIAERRQEESRIPR
jgi:hypothetical protein